MDRKSLIKALNLCYSNEPRCDNCPYQDIQEDPHVSCVQRMIQDTIEYLKTIKVDNKDR